MKIKSIAAICKKNKNIAIFERYSDDGDILTQYIGDGSAVYPVVGLPQLNKESLLTIFDGKWYYFSKESNSLGQMLANTTVDGYKLDANGVWNK